MENTKLLPEVLELHFGHFEHRITSGLIMSKDNLRASPRSITSEQPMSFARIYTQITCLISYARNPFFERSQSGSLLLSASYKIASQINQIK